MLGNGSYDLRAAGDAGCGCPNIRDLSPGPAPTHTRLIDDADDLHEFAAESGGMTRAMNRSIPFWILLAASVALVLSGALVVLDHLGTMTTTLKNGSATGLEVYAGQSWIVIGAALLGAGVLGVLLALALLVVSGLVAHAAVERVETGPAIAEAPAEDGESEEPVSEDAPSEEVNSADTTDDEAPQNGSSGSTATATKISVR